jgi:hypothetical protein
MKNILITITVAIAAFVTGWWIHSTEIVANPSQAKINIPEREDTLKNIIATDSFCNPNSLKEHLQYALHDTSRYNIVSDTVIPDKETAVKVAEALLFPVYGESQIKSERPYEVCFVDGYWVINGHQSRGEAVAASVGGPFVIIINAINAQVVQLTHYQ